MELLQLIVRLVVLNLSPPQQLAHEKQAGLNTVRRAIGLLNKLGAVRSLNGVGTQVLPPVDSAKNCDFEDPVIRRRLVDFLQSFHILAFSCRTCAQAVSYTHLSTQVSGSMT